jgi:hypothetical protein
MNSVGEEDAEEEMEGIMGKRRGCGEGKMVGAMAMWDHGGKEVMTPRREPRGGAAVRTTREMEETMRQEAADAENAVKHHDPPRLSKLLLQPPRYDHPHSHLPLISSHNPTTQRNQHPRGSSTGRTYRWP